MKYGIDLELYVLTIASMNSAFAKLEQNEFDDNSIKLLSESLENLHEIYDHALIDLSLSEVDYGEYDHFFMNAYSTFPRYIKNIEHYNFKIINNKLKSILNELLNLLRNFMKLAEDYFKKRGIIH